MIKRRNFDVKKEPKLGSIEWQRQVIREELKELRERKNQN
jgi:hypothetical protein